MNTWAMLVYWQDGITELIECYLDGFKRGSPLTYLTSREQAQWLAELEIRVRRHLIKRIDVMRAAAAVKIWKQGWDVAPEMWEGKETE